MQPTHAKWQQVPQPTTGARAEQKRLTNGLPNGHLTNGDTVHHDDDAMEVDHSHESSSKPTIFSDVSAKVSRNFTVVDTVFNAPPSNQPGYPGPDGHIEDLAAGPNGLSSVPDDLLDELPEDCRRAFEDARKTEAAWKKGWGTEMQSAMRGDLKVGMNGYPV